MRQKSRQPLPSYLFENLSAGGPVSHAVFTRLGGVSRPPYASLNLSRSGDDEQDAVFTNRTRAYATLGRTNDELVHAHLEHGSAILQVNHENYGQYAGPADGLITDEPGCGLTMNFADCAPILLYDPVNRAVGLGHSGWQGTVKDLPGALVRAMGDAFGSDPAEMVGAIGPAIGACCYEVGEPVISAVQDTFPDPRGLLLPQANGPRPHFDLPEANRRRLSAAGLVQIELSDLCTACRTDLFFSHRAEKGLTGRFGVVLILSDKG